MLYNLSCNGKLRFHRSTQKHVLWALTLNVAYKIYPFFRGKNLVALDIQKKTIHFLNKVRSHLVAIGSYQ